MPFIYRIRKDIIDPRPIRIQPGPSFYNYYWKILPLFDLNDKGEFVLPFSRRSVHTGRMLWPRSHQQLLPLGYELCRCIGCEKKTCEDHILNDYDSNNENLFIEEVYIQSKDEQNNDQKETSKELGEVQDNGNNNTNSNKNMELEFLTFNESQDLHRDNDKDDDYIKNDDHDDNWHNEITFESPSPFLYDPYESCDYEC